MKLPPPLQRIGDTPWVRCKDMHMGREGCERTASPYQAECCDTVPAQVLLPSLGKGKAQNKSVCLGLQAQDTVTCLGVVCAETRGGGVARVACETRSEQDNQVSPTSLPHGGSGDALC